MSRIRITCKPPTAPGANGVIASFPDVSVTAIADDGTETPLHDVTSVTFRCAADNHPATATLEFVDVEIDVEAEVTP